MGKEHREKSLRVVGLGQIMNKRGDWLALPQFPVCFVLLKQQQMTQSINVKYVDEKLKTENFL